MGLVVLFWRMATSIKWPALGTPRWLMVTILLTVGDQAVFFGNLFFGGVQTGYVHRNVAELVSRIPPEPAGQLVLNDAIFPGAYIAGCTPHVPFYIPETMVIPFVLERSQSLETALQSNAPAVASLGIRYALVAAKGSTYESLMRQGWLEMGRNPFGVLLAAPKK